MTRSVDILKRIFEKIAKKFKIEVSGPKKNEDDCFTNGGDI